MIIYIYVVGKYLSEEAMKKLKKTNKTIEELKESLRNTCISRNYDILWQWVKDGTISYKEFPIFCQFIASRERIYEESDGRAS